MFIAELIEGITGGGKGGDGVSIIGETREAITGGCLGLFMSIGFFFAFFFLLIAWLTGTQLYADFQIAAAGAPPIFFLCLAGLASPFVGIMIGFRGGRYSIMRHIGCFGMTIIIAIVAVIGLSLWLG